MESKRFSVPAWPVIALLALFQFPNLQASPGALKVRATDAAGNPVHEVQIEVFVAGDATVLRRGLTDHAGVSLFANLPHGDLRIVAHKAGFAPVETLVTEDQRAPELQLIIDQSLPQVSTDISVFGAVPRTAASAGTYRREEFSNRAIEDTGEVLRVIPGLVVVQHAGGGKSNQYLIRGFDADHGTDLALSFEGIPVNMVSHAHGQGYADLNFVIPETLATIDVYKGPYFTEFGNFATAGAATLDLQERFDHSFVKIQGGRYDTARIVAGWSPGSDKTRALIAVENRYTNGPFVSPQNFNRANFVARWSRDLPSEQSLTFLATAYHGKWNASGQIPLREVLAERLDRFGAIDPTEGGESSRFNFSIGHQKVWSRQALQSQFYVVRYSLDLFSNFTFFARDPARGDGIEQTDRRSLLGAGVRHHLHHSMGRWTGLLTSGFSLREDLGNVGLLRQERRRSFEGVVQSRLNERNAALFLQEEIEFSSRLKMIAGLRHDRFRFDAEDRLRGVSPPPQYRSFTGPKLSLIYTPARQAQFFANYGRGFHSNDARSVVSEPLQRRRALPAAEGYEAGYRQILADRLEITFAYWLLDLSGELVWAGDEGTTALSGPTRRRGPEVEARWKITDNLWVDAEAFYSRGRFRHSSNVIARAPRLVVNGGLVFSAAGHVGGEFRIRHVGDHPLAEDNSVQAQGYTIADLNVRKSINEHWQALLTVENLFNSKVREAQTFFASRLPGEPSPVFDTHFNPGYPFTVRLGLQYNF